LQLNVSFLFPYNNGCSTSGTIFLPPAVVVIGVVPHEGTPPMLLPLPRGCDPKLFATGGTAPKPGLDVPNPLVDAVPNVELLPDEKLVGPLLNPPELGVVGAGLTGVDLVAACNAIFCASLSPPANIIPDNVPVKNVAIGTISSKNF
jgi:hypothetical protein